MFRTGNAPGADEAFAEGVEMLTHPNLRGLNNVPVWDQGRWMTRSTS